MTVQLGGFEFEQATYDADADVLYLRRGEHRSADATYASEEGHAVQLDAEGAVIGLTIVNARWLLERDDRIVVTVPQQRIDVPVAELAVAMDRSLSHD